MVKLKFKRENGQHNEIVQLIAVTTVAESKRAEKSSAHELQNRLQASSC